MTPRVNFAGLRPLVAAATISLFACQAGAGPEDNSLVFSNPTDLTTADPAAGSFGSDIPVLYTMYDRLLDFDPADMSPVPMLATEWSWSEDYKTLTLKLREGVKFHDGTDFNAEAAKASLEHFKIGRNRDLENVASFDVIDEFTIAITSNEVNNQMLGLLADRAGMMVSPTALEEYGDDYALHPTGTGPFVLREHAIGQHLIVDKFDGYWNPEAQSLDMIEFRVIKNSTSAVAAMMTGQVDYLYSIDPVNVPAMERNPNLRVQVEPTIGFSIMKVNTSMPPIDKVEVRQAIIHAIDREALGKAVYGAIPTEPTVLPTPRPYWPSTDSVQDSVTYDPEKAKALLAKAGYPDGVTVPLCINSTSGMPTPGLKIADIMTAQMAPAGITLEVTSMATSSACSQKFNDNTDTPLLLIGWSGRPNPVTTYAQMMASNSYYNIAKNSYGNTDELLAKLQATFDKAEQEKIFDELNQNYVDYVPFISLYGWLNVVAYKKGLTGENPNLQGRPNVTFLRWE